MRALEAAGAKKQQDGKHRLEARPTHTAAGKETVLCRPVLLPSVPFEIWTSNFIFFQNNNNTDTVIIFY